MQNKKITMITMAILAVVAFVFAYVFVVQKQKEESRTKNQESLQEDAAGMESLPKMSCGQMDDQAAYAEAIVKRTIDFCGCIKEDKLKNTCGEAVLDMNYLDQAMAQMNSDICQEISSPNRKKDCLNIISSSVSYLEKNDPQKLADLNSKNHNTDFAIASYEKLLKDNPNEINNLIYLALSYAEKGLKEQEQGRSQDPFVEKAFAIIEKAKIIDKSNSEVYRVEGYINEIKPDIENSLTVYTKAIELDGKNIAAYAGRGHAAQLGGFLDRAKEDFDFVVRIDTDKKYSSVYANLCSLNYNMGFLNDAIKNCKLILASDQFDPLSKSSASQIMASMFMKNNDNLQAKSYLLKAKALAPNDPNLYVTLAKLNIYEQNYIESEANARKAMNLSPTKAISYLALADAVYMQEKYQESIQAAEKGIALVENDVSLLAPNKPAIGRDLYYSIANSYMRLNNTEKQKEFEKKAEEFFKQSLN